MLPITSDIATGAAQRSKKKVRTSSSNSSSGPAAPVVTATNAKTRSQSGAVPALPVGFTNAHDESEVDDDFTDSSSDDGSVDLGDEGQRIGRDESSSDEEDATIDVVNSESDSDPYPAANRRSRGGAIRGRGRSRGGSRGRGSSTGRGRAGVMVDSATAISRKRKVPSVKKRSRYMSHLTEQQWRQIEFVVKLLQPFADAQTYLEGERYITRSAVPFQINNIRGHLEQCMVAEDDALRAAGERLYADFNARWTPNWPRSTRMAVALDPRVKYMTCFDQREVRDETWADLRSEMKDLFMLRYAAPAQTQQSAPSSEAGAAPAAAHTFPGNEAVNPDAEDWPSDEDTCHDPSDPTLLILPGRIEGEIKLYKRELQIEPTADPLAWWRTRASVYPLLAVVARKWLAVPASSAASERLFSKAGLTVTDKRTRLGTEMVGTLVFLNSAWPMLEAKGILYGPNNPPTRK